MEGYIYLIGELDNPNMFKIGVTRGEINKRKKHLQTGSSQELYLCKSFKSKNPFKLEKLLHNFYKGKNTINEWFELNENDINDFIEKCQHFENILLTLQDNVFFNKKATIF